MTYNAECASVSYNIALIHLHKLVKFGDQTKCPRTESPGLKLTRIKVKVMVEGRFRVRAGIRH